MQGTKCTRAHLLLLVPQNCERSKDHWFESQAAIIMAAVMMEAFVNEFGHQASNIFPRFTENTKTLGQVLALLMPSTCHCC